jgi:hypothetical protein
MKILDDLIASIVAITGSALLNHTLPALLARNPTPGGFR